MRAEFGRSPVSLDNHLNQISQAHSVDMAQNNYFSHTNLQGESPGDRAIRSGFNDPVG